MRKRVLLGTLAAAALLVAPVAGADAQPNGDGGSTESKKCEKLRHVGFKVKGTLLAGEDLTSIDVEVIRANRHARDWDNFGTDDPTFVVDDEGDEKINFIGVTDTGTDGVDFEDAVGLRVKLKAKLALPKQGCDGEPELDVKKVTVKATQTD
jgi:hypothetical protein